MQKCKNMEKVKIDNRCYAISDKVLKVKMSKMSGKLKSVPALNTNTLTNNFCGKMSKCNPDKNCICTECYSHNMLKTFRQNCVPAFQHNSNLLNKNILTKNQFPKISTNNIIRINAHGELINEFHMINIGTFCQLNPEKVITLYTKRLNIVNKVLDMFNKPKNLIIVYSNPIVDKPINKIPENDVFKYVDKIFNVMNKNTEHKINCGQRNCNMCRKCYDMNKDKIIYEQIK